MKDKYVFREIKKQEIPQMFSLILQRMKWMDEKGIRQWNVTNYAEVYPERYYEAQREKGEVFVLAEKETEELVCAAVLKEEDERWEDEQPALYLHNYVSKVGQHGAGAVFLHLAEEYALEKGKRYFRLDSAVDNEALAKYYEARGFLPVGTCEEGLYKGILRQKELKKGSL